MLASMSPHTGARTILNSLTECNSLNKTCKQLRHWHPSEYSLYHLSITMSHPFDTMTVHGLYIVIHNDQILPAQMVIVVKRGIEFF